VPKGFKRTKLAPPIEVERMVGHSTRRSPRPLPFSCVPTRPCLPSTASPGARSRWRVARSCAAATSRWCPARRRVRA
jgi:hypothetical protein